MIEIINEFLNSDISMGSAIVISMVVCTIYAAFTFIAVKIMDYYDEHKKR